MANLAAGEVGIHTDDGREFTFRPSFRALADMGDVFELWRDLQSNDKDRQISAAGLILDRSMVDYAMDTYYELFGYNVPVGESLVFVPGLVPDSEQCILAFSLLRNGLLGDEKPKKSGSENPEFNPIDYVAAGVSHFGLETETVWNMTMHEFQAIMKSKYPDRDDFTPEKANDFLDKMDQLRANKDG